MVQGRELIKNFPLQARSFWENIVKKNSLEEIRIRADKPVILRTGEEEWFLDAEGKSIKKKEAAYCMSFRQIQELVDYWCKDSRYAFQKELRNGYLTLQGGHRVGICGEAVTDLHGEIQTIKNISSLNIRIARECKKAGEEIFPLLYENGVLHSTLIVSPPGAGKTTLLRDLVRRISDGSEKSSGRVVGLVDERGELAACYQGIPQLDIGLRTDVIDSCSKADGMICLLRSMSPQVIAVDELGSIREIKALLRLAGCGCSIMATVHGSSVEEIRKRRMFRRLWEERVFGRILILERKEGRYCHKIYQGGDLA
ncbi:MAG: stage III sporulation protein AA [Lachnospiraceae bacterium]